MGKLLLIFVTTCLLVSTALANVTLYKCLEGGDLCLTKSCCEEIEKASPCCSEHPVEVIMEDTCCDEVAIVLETVFKDQFPNKIKSIIKNQDFDSFLLTSPVQKNLIYSDIIRGPPLKVQVAHTLSSPIYIKHCSFLC